MVLKTQTTEIFMEIQTTDTNYFRNVPAIKIDEFNQQKWQVTLRRKKWQVTLRRKKLQTPFAECLSGHYGGDLKHLPQSAFQDTTAGTSITIRSVPFRTLLRGPQTLSSACLLGHYCGDLNTGNGLNNVPDDE